MKKIFKIGRAKLMLSGGFGKGGHIYGYAGIKDQTGLSLGTSIGTKGNQTYASYNKNGSQLRIMKNLTTGIIKPRLKLK
jgi:hypothetical protein